MVVCSSRPDLNQEAYMRERMNLGEKILYEVKPELQDLLNLPNPTDRATILKIFVEFCIEHDIIDLHCH
jgi:hypothetical protein